MLINKKLLLVAATATLGIGVMVFEHQADADLASCPVQREYTRFTDIESAGCGHVKDNNRNWGDFGWNDRADEFGNDGISFANCLYHDINCRGASVKLPLRSTVTWRNVVSSNFWTNGSCPTSC